MEVHFQDKLADMFVFVFAKEIFGQHFKSFVGCSIAVLQLFDLVEEFNDVATNIFQLHF